MVCLISKHPGGQSLDKGAEGQMSNYEQSQ